MPQSMTGFARCERILGAVCLVCRIKSVNHRFLDLAMRWPDGYESLERWMIGKLKERFSRGHLECTLSVIPDVETSQRLELNEVLLTDLFALEKRILDGAGGHVRERLSLDRLLSWPGMTQENRLTVKLDVDPGREVVLTLLDETIEALCRAREVEGQQLVGVMHRLLEMLQERVGLIEQDLPRIRALMESRLRERIENYAGVLVQDDRLAQELAYLLHRGDVTEELDRMAVHIREISVILKGSVPIGRRLDFLCQELNREANTLCTKVGDGELSCLGVDIKVLVEQMREQAQNLE